MKHKGGAEQFSPCLLSRIFQKSREEGRREGEGKGREGKGREGKGISLLCH